MKCNQLEDHLTHVVARTLPCYGMRSNLHRGAADFMSKLVQTERSVVDPFNYPTMRLTKQVIKPRLIVSPVHVVPPVHGTTMDIA